MSYYLKTANGHKYGASRVKSTEIGVVYDDVSLTFHLSPLCKALPIISECANLQILDNSTIVENKFPPIMTQFSSDRLYVNGFTTASSYGESQVVDIIVDNSQYYRIITGSPYGLCINEHFLLHMTPIKAEREFAEGSTGYKWVGKVRGVGFEVVNGCPTNNLIVMIGGGFYVLTDVGLFRMYSDSEPQGYYKGLGLKSIFFQGISSFQQEVTPTMLWEGVPILTKAQYLRKWLRGGFATVNVVH